jgi:hypothetical protein
MTHYRTALIALVLAAHCTSCRGPAGPELIPEETFVPLYADILVAKEVQSLRGEARSDSTARDSLYRAYGVTESDVTATLSHYRSELPGWKEFHVNVAKRLELLQREMAAQRIHR